MQFVSQCRKIGFSPYKLRPLVDVIRGKSVRYALNWLSTYSVKRVVPIKKMIESAAANAKYLNNISLEELFIKEIKVDEGPAYRYFKPGAMGRANPQCKRTSHIKVVLENSAEREA